VGVGDNSLKRTGLFFGFVFLLGLVIRSILVLSDKTGRAGSFFDSLFFFDLFSAALMFASAFVRLLTWTQPLVFLVFTPLDFMENAESFYGLGFFVMAVILLHRLGFYERHRILKLVASVAYLYGWELYGALRSNNKISNALPPIFYITAFLVFLYLVFHEKLAVYLKEPKASLSLSGYGLSVAERNYILGIISGKNTKEIAFDFEVSESTVRNTLVRAYKKLQIEDKSSLAALAEKYRIVE
jgi:DNA-binding CsgD family transcriptional regulator